MQRAGGRTNGEDAVAKALGSHFAQSHAAREKNLRLESSVMYRTLKYDVSSEDKETFSRPPVCQKAQKAKGIAFRCPMERSVLQKTPLPIFVVRRVHEGLVVAWGYEILLISLHSAYLGDR